MIEVTRINDRKLIINCDLIEFIEATPDTLITLTTGKQIIVKEDVAMIIDAIIAYKRKFTVLPG